jgi:hypothetical protein
MRKGVCKKRRSMRRGPWVHSLQRLRKKLRDNGLFVLPCFVLLWSAQAAG